MWGALAISLAVHGAALLLLAAPWGEPRIEAISIALYSGAGDGSAGGPRDGAGAGGDGEHKGASEEGQRYAPPESVIPKPAVAKANEREGKPIELGARPKTPDPAEKPSLVKPQPTAPHGTDATARVLAPKSKGDGPGVPSRTTSVIERNEVDSAAAGSAIFASRGEIGGSHDGSGEGAAGGDGGGGEGGIGGSGSDLQAGCIACPVPSYPRQARRRGWEGVVDLRLRLDPVGRVSAVGVANSSGFRVLDDAAVAAARRSRFRLRSQGGRTGSVWGRMRYRFEIGDG